MRIVFEWFIKFAEGIGDIWDFLVTPIEILTYNVAPIYLIVGTLAGIGLLRRLL